MKWRIAFLSAVVSIAPAAAWPEAAPDRDLSMLVPGSRVRVVSTSIGKPLTGIVLNADPESLTVLVDGRGPLKVPVATMTGVDVAVGRKRATRKGLLIGTAAGLAMGFAFQVDASDCDGRNNDTYCSRGEAVATGVLSGVATGAIVGALVRSDRWAPLTNVPRTGAAARPRFYTELAFRF